MTTYKPTPGEQAAYQRGLDERSEVLRLMGSEAYRMGDKAVHNRVQRFFSDAWPGKVQASVINPGMAPIGPGSRRD